jgi:LPPG:FO 2-phospho-L-lactate transferase
MSQRVLALSGGVGGAKLALGLSRILAPADLTIAVNTGDDFEHLGLYVSPDIDTLLYTLAGINNLETGWGRSEETWSFMAALDALGGPTWFRLGDKDLATNVTRTARLRDGATLSAVTCELCRALGVSVHVVPMSDAPVRTQVQTPQGWVGFQDYFVRLRCEPPVQALEYQGAAQATPAPGFRTALGEPLDAIVICPSNPYLSVDPMLSIPGLREGLSAAAAPVIAVSPIVAGTSIKGPTAKIMAELGVEQSAVSVARHYQGLIDGFVLDSQDQAMAAAIRAMGIAVTVTQTVMQSLADREDLARVTLEFAGLLASRRGELTEDHVGTDSR